jgi:outer membrane protein OmpA-like peptidoglycan-associated protein
MKRCWTLVAVVLAAATIAGCQNKDLQLLEDRNTQLTRENTRLQAQLEQAQTNGQVLRSANERLVADRDSLKTQVKTLEGQLNTALEDLRLARQAVGALPKGPTSPTPPTPPPPGPATPPTPPAPPTPPVLQWKLVFSLAGDRGFDSGKALLKDAAKADLDKIAAALLSAHKGKKIEISGHTDSDPIRRSKWTTNQALSQARAMAVAGYLMQKGVPGGTMKVIGWGDRKPIDPGSTPAAKARNRRVEIRVAQ